MGKIFKLGIVVLMLLIMSSFASAILNDNLQYYWTFNETTGNAIDPIQSQTLTQSGTVSSQVGKLNNSRGVFSDSNYFSQNINNINAGKNYSIGIWTFIKTGQSGIDIIYMYGTASSNDVRLSYRDGTKFQFVTDYSATDYVIDSAQSTNAWYYVVATYNEQTLNTSLYINGNYVGSNISNHNTLDQLYVGKPYNSGYSANEEYADELGIWNRTLTQAEITQLYNSGNGITYPFDISNYVVYAGAYSNGAQTGKAGVQITINRTGNLTQITKPSANTGTKAWLLSANGTTTIATTTSLTGNTFRFNPAPQLNASTTYILAIDNAGGAYTATYKNPYTFPVNFDYIKVNQTLHPSGAFTTAETYNVESFGILYGPNITSAPNTTATAIQQNGLPYTFGTTTNGNYTNVTLTCVDSDGGTCAITRYCIDVSNVCSPNITGNFTQINKSGPSSLVQYVRYASNDTYGNLEPTQSSQVVFNASALAIVFSTPVNNSHVNTNEPVNFTILPDTSPIIYCNWTKNGGITNTSIPCGRDSNYDPNGTYLGAWYKFDGDLLDSSGNGRKLINKSAISYIKGLNGQAMNNSNMSGLIIPAQGNQVIQNNNSWTVMAWINASNLNATYGSIVRIYNVTGQSSAAIIVANTTTPGVYQARCELVNSTGSTRQITVNNFYYGFWNHIACTYDGTNLRIYGYGVEYTSLTTTFRGIGSGNISIAGHSNVPELAKQNVLIDDVRIYNRTLTAQEILEHYNYQYSGYSSITNQTWVEGNNTVQVFAADANGFTATNALHFVKDTNPPTMNIYGPLTTNKYYNVSEVLFNASFADDNLYGFNVTCTNNGVIEFSTQVIGINTSTYNYSENAVFTNAGVKLCSFEVADAHTANEFDAQVSVDQGFLGMGTESITINDELSVSVGKDSELQGSIDYAQKQDRVSPIITLEPETLSWLDQLQGKELQDTYTIEWTVDYQGTAEKIDSAYAGHVVILPDGDLSKGYWVDAVTNVGGPDETIIANNEITYKKTISRAELETINYQIITESIGGLNIVTQNVSINITGGKWLEVNSTNIVNGSDAEINVTLDFGYNISLYNSSGHLNVPVDCNATTVTLTSLLFMNSHTFVIPETCGNTSVAAEFWQAELTANIKNILDDSLIQNSNGTMNASGNYNNESIFATGSTHYYLNAGDFNFTAEALNFTPMQFNQSIALGDNVTRDYSLTPIYNITFLRELTGEPLNFYENLGTYSCSAGTNNETVFTTQDVVDSPTCIGNFSTDHPCTNAYDGYTNTYASAVGNQTAQIVYQYPKPVNVTNESFLLLQRDYITDLNLSIPQTCYNQPNIKLNYTLFNASYMNMSCYNGTGFQFMDQYQNGALLFEDTMYWGRVQDVANTSTCTNLTSINVRFEVQCENEVLVSNLNATEQTISNIDCAYNSWYILVQYQTESYFRSLIPDASDFNFPIYLLDLNQDQAVEIIVQVKDLAANYLDGKLVVHKFINGSDEIVVEQFLDFEQKAILWLQKNQMYTICIEDDLGNVQCFKPIVADAAGTKTLTLPQLDAIKKGTEGVRDWDFEGTNQSQGVAVLRYWDKSAAGTASINWKITDEDGNVAYSTTNNNIHNVTLIASGLNRGETYYSILTVNVTNTEDGQLINPRPLWMKEFSIFEGFGEGDGSGFRDTLLLIIGILIPVLILMIGNERNGELMLAIALAVMFIFNLAHFYELMARTPGQQIALGGILALFGLFAGLMWIRKARRAE